MTAPPRDDELTYDVFDRDYVNDPFPLWGRLRAECPVAHSEAWGGSWMVTRYDDVLDLSHDPTRFSSSSITVLPRPAEARAALPEGSPPITCDPPHHSEARRPLSSWFSPRRAASLEPWTQNLCRRLLADLSGSAGCDAAAGYARRIPVAVIGAVLGVPDENGDAFVDLVHDIFTSTDDARRAHAITSIVDYFTDLIEVRRASPGTDLVSGLLQQSGVAAGATSSLLGTVSLILVAGIDTTAGVLGSALWHLATHDEDRRRLVAEPDLLPVAVEELLRAYAPATMARIVTTDVELHGRQLRRGERVLLNFPAANRDEEAFPDAGDVVLDRQPNRHLAFGAGIHRCVGSHLARMELHVALREWLREFPEFALDPNQSVTWSGGQVRGPQSLPLVFKTATSRE